jgi:hypothetical protein
MNPPFEVYTLATEIGPAIAGAGLNNPLNY